MFCLICNHRCITPSVYPYGGYNCGKDHLLCIHCNRETNSICPLCGIKTYAMKFSYCHPNELGECGNATDVSEVFSGSYSDAGIARQSGGDDGSQDPSSSDDSILDDSRVVRRRHQKTNAVEKHLHNRESELLPQEPTSSHNAADEQPKGKIKWTTSEVWRAMHEDCESPNYNNWIAESKPHDPQTCVRPRAENYCILPLEIVHENPAGNYSNLNKEVFRNNPPKKRWRSRVDDLEERVQHIVTYNEPIISYKPPIPEQLLLNTPQHHVQQLDKSVQPLRTCCDISTECSRVTFLDAENWGPNIGTQTEKPSQLNDSIMKRPNVNQEILTDQQPMSGVNMSTQTPDIGSEQSIGAVQSNHSFTLSDTESIDGEEWLALTIKSRKARVVGVTTTRPLDSESSIESLNTQNTQGVKISVGAKDKRDTKLKHDESFEPLKRRPYGFIQNLFNTYRVKNNPPERQLEEVSSKTSFETFDAPPQHELMTTHDWTSNRELERWYHMSKKPLDARTLNLLHSPLVCPDASCQAHVFISEFIRHLMKSHPSLPLVRIGPHETVGFCLDPTLPRFGHWTVNVCYMVGNVITNMGSEDFKDLVPLMVLTTKFRLHQILQVPKNAIARSHDHKFLVIWVAGLMPEDLKLAVTLTLWHRTGNVPTVLITNSGYMDNVRMSGSVKNVLNGGKIIIISEAQIRTLSKNRYRVIECQLQVH